MRQWRPRATGDFVDRLYIRLVMMQKYHNNQQLSPAVPLVLTEHVFRGKTMNKNKPTSATDSR